MFFGMITCANLLHWSSMLNMTLSSCFTSSAFGSFNKASLSGLSKINCWMLTDPTRNSFSRNGKISERSRRSSLVGNLRLAEKVFETHLFQCQTLGCTTCHQQCNVAVAQCSMRSSSSSSLSLSDL